MAELTNTLLYYSVTQFYMEITETNSHYLIYMPVSSYATSIIVLLIYYLVILRVYT